MAMWSNIPIVGDMLEKVVERVWPDKVKHAEKILDIELEEVRQSGGRMTPRMLLKYVAVVLLVLSVVWAIVATVYPVLPEFPIPLRELVSLLTILFGGF